MTWTSLAPLNKAHGSSSLKLPVSVSANGADGRFQPWLQVSFRPALLDVDFLNVGQSIDVQLGQGADAGKLRISAGGSFIIQSAGAGRSRDAEGLTVLRMPALSGQSKLKFSPTPVRHSLEKVASEALIIELPRWACPAEQTTSSASAEPSGAAAKPFKMSSPSHAEVLASRQGAR